LEKLLGGWPFEYPCATSKLSGMLGSWVTTRENYAVFWASSRPAEWVTGWKKMRKVLRDTLTDTWRLNLFSNLFKLKDILITNFN